MNQKPEGSEQKGPIFHPSAFILHPFAASAFRLSAYRSGLLILPTTKPAAKIIVRRMKTGISMMNEVHTSPSIGIFSFCIWM